MDYLTKVTKATIPSQRGESSVVGVGGKSNPNPMSVFEAKAGHYPYPNESGSKVTFDKNRK